MSDASGVLIVEDDLALSALLRAVLQRDGELIDIAGNGLEALERMSFHRYSLVLLDLMMPKLDGFGVIERLQQIPVSERPIVIVLSAVTENYLAALDGRVVAGILRKPFDVHELQSIVRACVNSPHDSTESLQFKLPMSVRIPVRRAE